MVLMQFVDRLSHSAIPPAPEDSKFEIGKGHRAKSFSKLVWFPGRTACFPPIKKCATLSWLPVTESGDLFIIGEWFRRPVFDWKIHIINKSGCPGPVIWVSNVNARDQLSIDLHAFARGQPQKV